MINLSDRLNNIESDLSLLNIEYSRAFKDGSITIQDNELGAVRDNIFGRITSLNERVNIIYRQLKSITNIINSAKRK